MINWKTYEQCYQEWLDMLSNWKKQLQIINKNRDSKQLKYNYSSFLQNTVDRKLNCIAGMVFDKENKLYCNLSEWESFRKDHNSSNH